MTIKTISVDFGKAEELRQNELRLTRTFANDNGITLVNCHSMTKRPIGKGWQESTRKNNARISSAIKKTLNPGFLLLDDVVDIDIDDSSILSLAPYFLPETCRYGRESKPASHWLMACTGDVSFTKIATIRGHVEIRTGKQQTLAPGSIHSCGEISVWEDAAAPIEVSAAQLITAVRLFVAGSAVARHWHIGQRDDLAVAVCGVMLRAGHSVRVIDKFIRAVCRACGDEQGANRVKANRLKKALAVGKSVPGIPALRRILGADTQVFLDAVLAQGEYEDPLQLIRADRIEPESVDWLWYLRLALGKLSIFAGDPGTSKSMATLDIAARVTTRRSFPDGTPSGSPAHVILVAGEDDPADTIIPRFIAAGGDRKRLHVLTSGFSLHKDLDRLRNALERIGQVRLIIFDPITEFLGSIKNSNDTTEVRSALAPLTDLLRNHNVACIAVSHLNKDQTKNAVYRTTGSLAFVAVARAVYLIGRDSDDSDRRIMIPIKNNLGPDSTGLAYSIRETKVHGIVTTRVAWEENPVSVSADELLGGHSGPKKMSPKLADASAWLVEQLLDGPVKQRIVRSNAAISGISAATLRRAKLSLGIDAVKLGEPGENGHWEWRLP